MRPHQKLIADIEKAPRGPSVAALFDFDGTIIAGYSATAFLQAHIKRGDLSVAQLVALGRAMGSFGLGQLGFSALMLASAQFLRGMDEQSHIEFGEHIYQTQLARLIYPESRALVQAHLRCGHTVAIVSSATPYQVRPAARDLDIEHVLCTELAVEGGAFTGEILPPACFGQGKVDAAQALAQTCGFHLDQSYFYSDSSDDLALLERVAHPRVLNPNPKLKTIARNRGWPIRRFSSRGRPTMAHWMRSIAATGSLVSSFAAGLPVWALTGSRREAQNFSLSLFADVASALIGLEMDVSGEQHLWAQRPAVFVINHQSTADLIIVARLLRRDIAGVGKEEIRKLPLIGNALEFGGVVLIDRKNAASAIEALAPLVDVVREEGKSIALAPEGTRTVTPKLAPFKKGAFHLAMQAGVPVVPIVIHNALDVAPKGEYVFRPATVKIDVLPPVSTKRWRVSTIDKHVAEVRNLFLRTLGQDSAVAEPCSASARRVAKTTGTEQKTKDRGA